MKCKINFFVGLISFEVKILSSTLFCKLRSPKMTNFVHKFWRRFSMFLKHIKLLNFKNYASISLDFDNGINCILGNNGIGKTNILDAIHYLCLCKSFINPIDTQNIRFDEPFLVIEGHFLKNETLENIFCGYKRGSKKTFKKNKKEYEKLADHIGLFPVSVITPTDNELLLGGSEVRRKFIDSTISQYDKSYLYKLQVYNSILIQRNSLLKTLSEKGKLDALMLEVYDEQLEEPALYIYEARKSFLEEFTPLFNNYYHRIASISENVSVEYISHLNENNDWKNLMKNGFQADRVRLFTTKGIHKDDLELQLNNFPVKRFGSQGQQKSFLLAMKLAQFTLLKQKTNTTPILLLDDIFDKIDQNRLENLLEIVNNSPFGQIFITDTGKSRIEEILLKKNFRYRIIFPEEVLQKSEIIVPTENEIL